MFGRDKNKSPTDIIELIDHRWLLEILRAVASGPQRHRDLLAIDGLGSPVYAKTLLATLNHLRDRGLISSETVRESPPIREYRATPLGLQLLTILELLVKFIDEHPEVRPQERRQATGG